MSDISMGINPEMVEMLFKELQIKPDRYDAIYEVLTEAIAMSGEEPPNPFDMLQRFIAKTSKANELAFLCFMAGTITGTIGTLIQSHQNTPEMLKKAMIFGATHSEDVQKLAAENGYNLPTATAAEAKKVKHPDDIMYG
jgi:hypothetical protein